MFCNELVSDAADDGAAVPSASFSENEVVKLAKRPRLFKDISTGTIFFLTRQFVAAEAIFRKKSTAHPPA